MTPTKTNKRNRIIIAVLLLILGGIAYLVFSKKGTEREFALSLSNDMCRIINTGLVKIPSPGEDRVYADTTNYQLKLVEGTSLPSPFGEGGSGTRVEFEDYDSPIGKLNGRLSWETDYNRPEGSNPLERVLWNYTTQTVVGRLVRANGDSIKVNFSFRSDRNPNYPFKDSDKLYDLSKISLLKGTIQIDDRKPINF